MVFVGWYLIMVVHGNFTPNFPPRPMNDLQDCLVHAVEWEAELGNDFMCINNGTRELANNYRGSTKYVSRKVDFPEKLKSVPNYRAH